MKLSDDIEQLRKVAKKLNDDLRKANRDFQSIWTIIGHESKKDLTKDQKLFVDALVEESKALNHHLHEAQQDDNFLEHEL